MEVEIISIGFDGPNRVGKGTQCALMQRCLAKHGIPALIIRGDGSRTGTGDSPGNPESAWWRAVNQWLHHPKTSGKYWNVTSYRLARELVVWRDRILPNLVKTSPKKVGVLLIDRSLLSRTMVLRAMKVQDIANNLYPAEARLRGRKITPELVCPDLILNLTAPKHILLARLNPHDPKYEFRKRLIAGSCDWFKTAPDHIPHYLRSRVIDVDASRDPNLVFNDSLAILLARFDGLRGLTLSEQPLNCCALV
jgi:thymidylate kinase